MYKFKNFRQCVILAGGRGIRLRPLTNDCPKALVNVNGLPFMHYLMKQCDLAGFEELVVLSGYLSEKVTDFLKLKTFPGLLIRNLITDEIFTPGERIIAASEYLDNSFILMYCDNLAPINWNELNNQISKNPDKVILNIFKKENGNVKIMENNLIHYNSKRGLDYTEVGYSAMPKEKLLNSLKNNNNDLSASLTDLSKNKEILAVKYDDNYLSISDVNRKKSCEKILRRSSNFIFLDRDGTINLKPKKGRYITSAKEVKLIKRNVNEIANLSSKSTKFIVISNQAGIGRGIFTVKELKKVNYKIKTLLKRYDIQTLEFYTCIHDWNSACECRKPRIGLFHEASRKHLLFLGFSSYICDDERDVKAAFSAGMWPVVVPNSKFYKKFKKKFINSKMNKKIKKTSDTVNYIRSI